MASVTYDKSIYLSVIMASVIIANVFMVKVIRQMYSW